MKALILNWKTTIAGLAASALNLYANGTDPKQIALSVGIGLLGLLAHDGKSNDAKN